MGRAQQNQNSFTFAAIGSHFLVFPLKTRGKRVVADGEFSPLPLLWEPFSPLVCVVVAGGALHYSVFAPPILWLMLFYTHATFVSTHLLGLCSHTTLLIAAVYMSGSATHVTQKTLGEKKTDCGMWEEIEVVGEYVGSFSRLIFPSFLS